MQANKKAAAPEYQVDAPTIEEVQASSGTLLLEFGTPWCGHCQAAQAMIAQALLSHPEVQHIKVYDGKGKKLGRSFKVKLWPSLILLRNGQELGRLVRPQQTADINLLLSK
jgi:thioredoxin 1